MNPIKFIRKIGKILRGGATFREMFLGALLGFAVGMIPGVNLTLIILIILLLFLNTNGVLAALSILIGRLLSVILAPVTFQIGYVMIHGLGLEGVVRAAGGTPVLALLDLQVYCLLGALPVIIVLGIPLGWFASKSIIKMRKGLAAAAESSAAIQKVAGNRFARLVVRILFGKQKQSFAEMSARTSPLIRKGRVIVALVLVAVLVVLQFIFLDSLVRTGLEKSIAAANGAEVNIARADLSLGSGRLVIEGLQVTDAARPSHNRVQAERIVADVSVADLLARRFVVELLECRAMRTDRQRKTPGEVYRKAQESKEEKGAAVASLLTAKLGKSAEYYAEVKKFNERLGALRKYLKSSDPKAPEKESSKPDKDALAARARAEGYWGLSARDSLAKTPTWVIRNIKISQIELRDDLPTFIVEGKHLASHPSLYPEKMELTARPDEEALKAFLAKLAGDKGDLLKGILGGKKTTDKTDESKKKGTGLLKDLFGK